jgi:glycosyltransferase involved in cell wall biosynthesis
MARIHLMTPHTRPGDAVTNDLLGMQRWLRCRGHEAHAYAEERHRSLRHAVRPLKDYLGCYQEADDLLIYHHSVGWPRGVWLFERTRNRRVVRHHNVTPGGFLGPYNRLIAAMCRRGQRQTRRLIRTGAERWLADSAFNVEDVVAAGARPRDCRVVYPFHTIEEEEALPLDEALADRLRGRTNLLFVGRVAPNKGHLHLIRTLGYYLRHIGDADLILAGSFLPGLEAYRHELELEVLRLRLQGKVHFTDKLSPEKLRTYYRHATVFLCASEHEGCCVPLVEAMYHRVPIVAFGGSAVPHTLGDAGLYWDTPAPALLAESVGQIVHRPEIRDTLVARQWARYQAEFTTAAIGAALDAALAPILAGAPAYA